jgi:hypothetical protein
MVSSIPHKLDDQVIRDETPIYVLSGGDRQISRLRMLRLALWTVMLYAQVGQEGIREAAQIQVDHCGPTAALLAVALPRQRLGFFHKRLNRPPACVRQHKASREKLRVVGHQPENLPDLPFAREDHMQGAEAAHGQLPASRSR